MYTCRPCWGHCCGPPRHCSDHAEEKVEPLAVALQTEARAARDEPWRQDIRVYRGSLLVLQILWAASRHGEPEVRRTRREPDVRARLLLWCHDQTHGVTTLEEMERVPDFRRPNSSSFSTGSCRSRRTNSSPHSRRSSISTTSRQSLTTHGRLWVFGSRPCGRFVAASRRCSPTQLSSNQILCSQMGKRPIPRQFAQPVVGGCLPKQAVWRISHHLNHVLYLILLSWIKKHNLRRLFDSEF